MEARNTLVRSLHDLSLATWFGGNLMGVVGLNGATAKAKDSTDRIRLTGDQQKLMDSQPVFGAMGPVFDSVREHTEYE